MLDTLEVLTTPKATGALVDEVKENNELATGVDEVPENPVDVEPVVVEPVPERLKVNGAVAPGAPVLEQLGFSAKLKEKLVGAIDGLLLVVELSVLELLIEEVDGGATNAKGVVAVVAIVEITGAAKGGREVEEKVKFEGVATVCVNVVVVIVEAGVVVADPARDDSTLKEKLVFRVGTGSAGLDATKAGVDAEADKAGGAAKPNDEIRTAFVVSG